MAKVLLIDDDGAYARMMDILFKMKKIEFRYETDGNKAIDAYRQMQPDIILLDVNLGIDKTGIDILREIRKKDRKTKVILISGLVDANKYYDAAKELEIQEFMNKPIAPDKLLQKIKELCG